VQADLWKRNPATADTVAGKFRSQREIPLAEVRPFIVDVGNNGELSQTGDYWTTEEDLKRLFEGTIPDAAEKGGWKKRRVMLYLHGGLNSERDAAKRAIAFRDVFLENEIYPLHIMWETGPLETLGSALEDRFTDADKRAGGGLLQGMKNAKDRMLELTASAIGTTMWSEMKENAWRASDHRKGIGAMQLMKKYALQSLAQVPAAEQQKWELHIVAHSAGSILFTHAIKHLCGLGIPLKTLQLLAPAVRIDEFTQYALPEIVAGNCPKATLYMLSKEQELDDTVGPYGKSLLWLVSNAFEGTRGTPILGMKEYLDNAPSVRNKTFTEVLTSPIPGPAGSACTSETHGGFDNDAPTMNSVIYRILGRKPAKEFRPRDLDYG
jgi:hypothetical protein